MTLVGTTPPGTTPPPRLPVRERATAGARAGSGLSPMLTRLAAERATGVLERERGSLYLAEGRVVHAESPLAPGLDVLLLTHGTLDNAAWREALERADERHGALRLLLDAERIPRGALELCHLGALYDAAYFALTPSSTPGRFRYGAGHPLGVLRPVPVGALERETMRRRELLERLWPDPLADGAPLLRAEAVAAPAPTARQNAVLALVNGVRTASDIARELGRQAFHTLVDVRRLAAAGLLTALFPPPLPHLPPGAPGAPGALGAPGAPGPMRAPGAPGTPGGPGASDGPGAPDTPGIPGAPGAPPTPHPPPGVSLPRVNDPDITLLKRLRDALEAL
ncbi:transcriptional regulator [Streptomyces sp. NPDC096132]|uniref:transcriptional regulator n=1 Tax=Streptomyces sp. NPDC096132 TaxID=3366075 RepID=UPI0037FE207C